MLLQMDAEDGGGRISRPPSPKPYTWSKAGGCCGRRIMTDEAFQRQVLSTVVKAGAAVEEALGSAQDIEGVIDAEGNLTVVQTRPQM